jgi:hypothetical protein
MWATARSSAAKVESTAKPRCWLSSRGGSASLFLALLEVQLDLFPPDARRRDWDNFQKGIWDSLQHAGVYLDDSQVKRAVIEMHPPSRQSRAEVAIAPYITPSPKKTSHAQHVHEHELDDPTFDPDDDDWDGLEELFKVTSPEGTEEVYSPDEACDLILDLVEQQFWEWYDDPACPRRFKPRVKVYEVR